MALKLISISFLVMLSGCFITNTPGFYSGYEKLSEESRSEIVFVDKNLDICKLQNDQKIYAISASQLLNCLKEIDSSVIYFWSPNCSSESCIPINVAQQYCNKNNYTLFLITEYYDMEKTSIQNVTSLPIFSINHLYYNTNYCNKYVKLFQNELLKNVQKENDYNRFYIFNKDTLNETRNFLIK